MLKDIAKERGISVVQVSLRWVMEQDGGDSTNIGARTAEQLRDNPGTLKWNLSAQEIERLNEVSAIHQPYPQWMIDFQGQGRYPNEAGGWDEEE